MSHTFCHYFWDSRQRLTSHVRGLVVCASRRMQRNRFVAVAITSRIIEVG
jgi:hypothetical protein